MQVDDRLAASGLMKPVDVLRDEQLDAARALEPRERAMRAVRRRTVQMLPADEAARPVAPARSRRPS